MYGSSLEKRKDGPEFDQVLEMVRTINKLEMEVCCTLGMITENQAQRLAEAGLYAYNHLEVLQKNTYKSDIRESFTFCKAESKKNVEKTEPECCGTFHIKPATRICTNKRFGSR
jgi:biotin synthase